MPKISFIAHDGTEHVAKAEPSLSVMKVAINNMVPGIDADCGGACACATCHVYVDPAWIDRTGAPDDMEQAMLEYVAEPEPTSRLSCQIVVTADMDGLVVRLPRQQG
jgi:2Fe-2S ferredoxin